MSTPMPMSSVVGRTRGPLLARVALVALAVGALAACGDTGTRVGKVTAHRSAGPSQVTESSTPDPAPTTPASKTGTIGDTFTITQDGADTGEITASSPTASTSAPDEFADKPANGYYLTITISAQDIGSDTFDVNPFDFYVRLPDGRHIGSDAGHAFEAARDDALNAVTLNPGENVKGTVVFDVPSPHGQLVYAPLSRSLGSWSY